MKDLKDKVVMITGGASGIGFSTAQAFLKAGSKVCLFDHDESKLKVAMAKLDSNSVLAYRGSTESFEHAHVSVQRVLEKFGSLDVLVNGAARFIMRGVEATPQEWEDVLKVNVTGYALMASQASVAMKQSGKGAIINIASISSEIAQKGMLTYNTSKGALLVMTRCLAMELAPFNIRVNSVCPGTVWTDLTEEYIGKTYGLNRREAEAHPELGAGFLLKRFADPVEIANPILFLASDFSSYMTGANLFVDAGFTAQ